MITTLKKGRLYVRTHNGGIEFFFYPTEEVVQNFVNFKCVHIAKIRFGEGLPDEGNFIDMSKNLGYPTSGNSSEFRQATDADICVLIKNWSSPIAISEWVKMVRNNNPLLLTSEKSRISRVVRNSKIC